jgi:hypothetical protein
LVREYEVLRAADDFPEFALDELKRISRSFHWQPPANATTKETLAPCFGVWLFDDHSMLLIRFVDEGRDDCGRPHLLRFDAALLPRDAAIGIEDVPLLLGSETWPEVNTTALPDRLVLGPGTPAANVAAVSAKRLAEIGNLLRVNGGKGHATAIITGPHRSYVYTPADYERVQIVGPDGGVEDGGRVEDTGRHTATAIPAPRIDHATGSVPQRSRWTMRALLILLVLFCLAEGCWLFYVAREKTDLDAQVSTLSNERRNLRNNLVAKDEAIAKLDRDKHELLAHEAGTTERAAEVQKDNDGLRQQLREQARTLARQDRTGLASKLSHVEEEYAQQQKQIDGYRRELQKIEEAARKAWDKGAGAR